MSDTPQRGSIADPLSIAPGAGLAVKQDGNTVTLTLTCHSAYEAIMIADKMAFELKRGSLTIAGPFTVTQE